MRLALAVIAVCVVHTTTAAAAPGLRCAGTIFDCGVAPGEPGPVVTTVQGAAAWTVRSRVQDRLYALSRAGAVELDAAGPGAITELRATASGIAWRSSGLPREAPLR